MRTRRTSKVGKNNNSNSNSSNNDNNNSNQTRANYHISGSGLRTCVNSFNPHKSPVR